MVQILISLTLFVVSFSKQPIPSEERCNQINKCFNPIRQECSYLAPCPKMDYCNGLLKPICGAYPNAQCKFNGCGECNTYFVDEFDQIITNCDDNICTLPAETGICRGAFPRYYFNDETQECEQFIYGGCGGNANNFNTLEECENECNINICNLPSETGPCKGAFRNYFYNDISGHCEEFIYGGCKGNENNFETLYECQQTCDIIPDCVPKGGSFMADPKTCTLIDFICGLHEDYWVDNKCGCGCKPKKIDIPDCVPEGWSFAGNPKQCMLIKYLCVDDMEHWSLPECGCGCKPKEIPSVCELDVKQCSDGSYVNRNPLNNCEFDECPKCNDVKCLIEPCKVSFCDNYPNAICTNNYCDGCNAIWTDINGNDITNKCIKPISTTSQPICVPNGWYYSGDNDFCMVAFIVCNDGFEHWSLPNCGCGCKPKDINPTTECPPDIKQCSDGSYVNRDPLTNCEFFYKCPKCDEIKCLIDPCQFSSCDNYPNAICTNNKCNSCNAIWTDINGNDITNKCIKTTTTTTIKPTCVPDNWIFIGDNELCNRINFYCDENSEYWSKSECGCGCRPKCVTGGCSGQMCGESGTNMITTCEYKCEYDCRKRYKICGRQINNENICQWYFNDNINQQEYNQCVAACNGGPM